MPFKFTRLAIADLILIEPVIFADDRGFFLESYKYSDFVSQEICETFVQDNHSQSQRHVLRGLHYQLPPKAQGKLVRVVKGAAWDVAVDIRRNSSTFLQWRAVELDDRNQRMLYIPPGFAHGFLALSDEVHLLYKCTSEYDRQLDSGIRYDDPDIGIDWPTTQPQLSAKDLQLPYWQQAQIFEMEQS